MRRRAESVHPRRDPDPAAFLPLPHLPHHVLLALAERPRHGWGIVKRIAEITGGRARPSSGSLYLAIGRLEERGLIEEAPADAARAAAEVSAGAHAGRSSGERRSYRLTPLGRRVLSMETARLADLVGLARRWLGPEEGGTRGGR